MPMTILGVACGNPAGVKQLRRQHAQIFSSAHVISGSSRLLAELKEGSSARLLPLELPIRPFLATLGQMSRDGLNILLLADGDPLFFGLASTLAEMSADWPYEVIPAISSLQLACARLGLPWANMATLSMHGRKDLFPLYSILASEQNFCLLAGTGSEPAELARFMLDRGCDNYKFYFFQDMGSVTENSGKLSLEECAQRLFSSNCLCLFIHEKKEKTLPILTEDSPLLGAYCTPKSRRGQILELLDLEKSDLVWDIGAGSGLLSYEIATRSFCSEVWAVEEKSGRALDIQYNRKLLSCPNLRLVLGHAPEILHDLPSPSRIFIGGGLSASDAPALLDYCMSRLLPGGKLVSGCILMENLQKCLNFQWGESCRTEFFQSQILRGERLGKGFRLMAENPIFLFKVEKGKSSKNGQ